jgi:hypothetical protein
LGSNPYLLLNIWGNITQLLLDVTDDFTLSVGSEGVSAPSIFWLRNQSSQNQQGQEGRSRGGEKNLRRWDDMRNDITSIKGDASCMTQLI